jgi:hypothetical protein
VRSIVGGHGGILVDFSHRGGHVFGRIVNEFVVVLEQGDTAAWTQKTVEPSRTAFGSVA